MWASHKTVRKAFDSPVKPVTGNDTTSKAGSGFGVLSRSVQRLALPTLPAGRGKHLVGACRLDGSRLAVVTWRAPPGLAPASSLPNIARGIGADSGYGMTEGGAVLAAVAAAITTFLIWWNWGCLSAKPTVGLSTELGGYASVSCCSAADRPQ